MKWSRWILYVIAPLFFFAFSTYMTITILLKVEQTVITPDIRGKEINEARRILQSRGIPLNIVRYERRNDIPYNHVSVQKPEADVPMRKGRSVNVLVSEGPELIKLPAVVGQSIEDVTETLELLNIKIGKVLRVPHAEGGKVLAQVPKGGEEITVSQKVMLFVGDDSRRYYLMPDFRGSLPTEAGQDLDARKLRYKMQYTRRDYGAFGRIVATSPAPGTIFSSDEDILISVSPDI